jgi:TonB family protein
MIANSYAAWAASPFLTRLQQWVGTKNPSSRALSLVLAAIGHLVLIWLLASQLLTMAAPDMPTHELPLNLVPMKMASHSDMTPQLAAPALVVVPAPDIQIVSQDESRSSGYEIGDDQIIAPRPDPNHANDLPTAAGLSAAAGRAAEVVLRILVRKDGTIGDANVEKSCGTSEVDMLALEFVKSHWRYLAATLAGQPIDAWTTVLVRFR